MTKLRYAGVALAAVLMAALCVLVPGQSNALTLTTSSGGPGVTQQPGPYYNAGQLVGICVATSPGASTYVEIHTYFGTAASPNPNALGNCAAGRTQLVVAAVPPAFDVNLAPAPTTSPTGSGL